MNGPREPPVGVDGAVAEDLEVLGLVAALCLGVVEAVQHAYAFDRLLGRAVHDLRLGQASRF